MFMKETTHFENVIAGAGILGLLIAYELLKKTSPDNIIILEKEAFVGEHSSSRNSGVLHAGIYYETGSLKHLMCIEGRELWNQLAHDFEINVNKCGKYLIAVDENEEAELAALCARGTKNGVLLQEVNEGQLVELKGVITYKKVIYSPNTAVIDLAQAIKKLENYLERSGVIILKSNAIEKIEIQNNKQFLITTNQNSVLADKFINTAGLGAVAIRKMLGLVDVEASFVKGNYLKLNSKFYNQKLLYPVPEKNLKGLGVHTTFDIDGNVRFGPNTEDIREVDYRMNDDVIEQMYPSIKKVFPSVVKESLSLDYCGVRSKIIKNGISISDFYIGNKNIHGINNYHEALGIESPGFTSSPAIAKEIVQNLQ
jgi:L-2-hydroxyglutarate oxidase LhgO